jgi:hypothetical protein
MDSGRFSGWFCSHPIRFLIYATLLTASLVAVVVVPLLLCDRENTRLTQLVNFPIWHRWGEALGVRFQIESLEIDCRSECGPKLGIRGLRLDLLGPEVARFQAESIQWCLRRSLSIQSVRLGNEPRPALLSAASLNVDFPSSVIRVSEGKFIPFADYTLVNAEEIKFFLSTRQAKVRLLRVLSAADPTDSLVRVSEASLGPITLPAGSAGAIDLGPLRLQDTEILVQRGRDQTWNYERARLFSDTNRELTAFLRSLTESGMGLLSRVQDLVRRMLIGTVLVILLAKLALTRAIRSWPLRLAVSGLAVVVPWASYHLLRGSLAALSLLVSACLVSVVVAFVAQRAIYRKGQEWHQRWEPFVIDVLAFFLLLPLLMAEGVRQTAPAMPNGLRLPDTILYRTKARLCDPADQPDLATLSLPEARVTALEVKLDAQTGGARDVRVGQVFGQGMLESTFLMRELEPLSYVPSNWKRPQSLGLCLDVRAQSIRELGASSASCTEENANRAVAASDGDRRTSLSQPLPGKRSLPSHPELMINARFALDTPSSNIHFSSFGRLRSTRLHVQWEAAGQPNHVEIRSLHSVSGSPVEIVGGSGHLTIRPGVSFDLQLQKLGFQGRRGIVIARPVQMALSAQTSGQVTLKSVLGRVSVNPVSETTASISGCEIHLERNPRVGGADIDLESRLQDLKLISQRPGVSAPWLSVRLPRVRWHLWGSTGPGRIPETFRGSTNFSVQPDPSGPLVKAAVEAKGPLTFSANLHRGTVGVPSQRLQLAQTLFAQAPGEVSLEVSMEGRVESVGSPLRAGLSYQIRALSNGSEADAPVELKEPTWHEKLRWGGDGLNRRGAFQTGLNRVRLAGGPVWTATVKAIPDLDLATQGSLPAIPESTEFQLGEQPFNISPVFQLPEPDDLSFKIHSAWPPQDGDPLLQVVGTDGKGLQIKQLETRLERVLVENARLESLVSTTRILGLQALDAGGNLQISARSELSPERLEVVTAVAPADSSDVMVDGKVVQEHNRLAVEFTGGTAAGRLVPEAIPFLKHFDLYPKGLDLRACISDLRAHAELSGGSLEALGLRLGLGGGPLANFDVPSDDASIGSWEFSFPRSLSREQRALSVEVSVSRGPKDTWPAAIQLATNGLAIRTKDSAERKGHATVDLKTKALFTLGRQQQVASYPAVDKINSALTDLRRHLDQTRRVFQSRRTAEQSGLRDLRWEIDLKNRSSKEPAFSFDPERLTSRLRTTNSQLKWGTTGQTSISWSGDLGLDLAIHQDHLVADGHTPFILTLAGDGRAADSSYRVNLPFLVGFSDTLQPASTQEKQQIWNSDYYEAFWRTYVPVNANSSPDSAIEESEVSLGPASLQQISFPVGPLRIHLGLRDHLQVHLPLKAHAGFGEIEGVAQGDISWKEKLASLTSAVNATIRRFQAGAIGLATEAGHAPLIEDQLGGALHFRTDGVVLDQKVVDDLSADISRFDQFQRLGIDFSLGTAREELSPPGMIQVSSGIKVDLLNDLLNRIVRQVQLSAPPAAVSYRNLSVHLHASQGNVSLAKPFLRLEGIRLPASNLLEFETDLNVHLARKDLQTSGHDLSLRALVEYLTTLFHGAAVPEMPSRLE